MAFHGFHHSISIEQDYCTACFECARVCQAKDVIGRKLIDGVPRAYVRNPGHCQGCMKCLAACRANCIKVHITAKRFGHTGKDNREEKSMCFNPSATDGITKECPKCGLSQDGTNTACEQCGYEFPEAKARKRVKECPQCGAEQPLTARRCSECGAIFQISGGGGPKGPGGGGPKGPGGGPKGPGL
jgi:NAD-dependent dihydropyrimidine dehydrogenase PreA subunit